MIITAMANDQSAAEDEDPRPDPPHDQPSQPGDRPPDHGKESAPRPSDADPHEDKGEKNYEPL
jgi:hypothetical protein